MGVISNGGSATVTIDNSVKTLLDGAAFTVSSNEMSIDNNQFGSLMVTNPADSIYLMRVFTRRLSCDLPANVVQAKYAGLANVTTNLPPTVVSSSNRARGHPSPAVSPIVARAGVTTAQPTYTGAPLPVGNILAGGFADLDEDFETTLYPGQTFCNWIRGVSTGLTGVTMVGVVTYSYGLFLL